MATITVIVPIYKVEKYIKKCVESIMVQSFQDFDLVLVDDGSPDACPGICDEYAELDERIVVIHKENGGLSDARNAGIDWAMENSESKWLAFVDSDDYLHPDYLKTLYDTAQKEEADLVICDFVRVNDNEEIIEEPHDFYDLVTENKREMFDCLFNNWRIVPAWNKLYHRSIFAELRFEFGKIHEDEFAIHHVLWNSKKTAVVSNGLYYYRIRENSIMKTETPESKMDGFEALVERYEFCRSYDLVDMKKNPMDYLHSFASIKRKLKGDRKKQFRSIKKRFSKLYFSDPSNRKPKRWAAFYFRGIYHKSAELYNSMKTEKNR